MVVETDTLKGLPLQQGALRGKLFAILSDVFQVPLNMASGDILQQELDVWDSFNHLRLVLELEQSFNITLSDADTLEMTSLNKMESLLQARGVS
jgi:acyl carrier protein